MQFIQRERDDFYYYSREYNDKEEQISQIRIQLKEQNTPSQWIDMMKNMFDGDRLTITKIHNEFTKV